MHVHRLETSAVQLLSRKARESDAVTILFLGLSPESGAHADLKRGGIEIIFVPPGNEKTSAATTEKGILAFQECANALLWCKLQTERLSINNSSDSEILDDEKGM